MSFPARLRPRHFLRKNGNENDGCYANEGAKESRYEGGRMSLDKRSFRGSRIGASIFMEAKDE